MNEFSRKLIDWYKKNHRDLPWRSTKDPYIIWVSEIILQQTRVAQGYDYFLRFVSRFPDVKSLAEADEDDVLKLWQGLGYYSRARNLHQAAKQIKGSFPDTYEEVRALKGVGDYTAAAVCSISFDLPYAVVDGNVYRVLSRWLGLDLPIDSTVGKKEFARAAFELLDRSRPGLHNQAIMEFGALQCVPSSPDCNSCPLSGSCAARRDGLIGQLPVKQHRTSTTDRYFNYIYVRMGAYTFINRREGNDIWMNLFELPLIEASRKITEEELLAHPTFQLLSGGSGESVLKRVRQNVKHVLSHQIIHTDLYEITIPEKADTPLTLPYLKIRADEIGNYAMPKLVVNLIENIRQ